MEHVLLERMLPHEFEEGGKNLLLDFSFSETPFGRVLIASTDKGIAFMAFADEKAEALKQMLNLFPGARYQHEVKDIHKRALEIFSLDLSHIKRPIEVHVNGTDFEIKVWKALIKIPCGQLTSYGEIAQMVSSPDAARAVGNAISKNPVAYLIPCHRVIRQNGKLGGYVWGIKRKTEIINWERL